MRKSVYLFALLPLLSMLSIACVPSTLQDVAFEPRVYPYVPELGSSDQTVTPVTSVAAVQR